MMYAKKLNILRSVLFIGCITIILSCAINRQFEYYNCGNITKTTSDSLDFNNLSISCDCDIILVPSSTEYYQIKTGNEFINNIDITNRNNSLVIKQDTKFIRFKDNEKCKCEINIGINKLHSFSFYGVGKLLASELLDLTETKEGIIARVGEVKFNIRAETLNLEFNNVGNVNLAGTANKVKIINNSNGIFNAKNLIIDNLEFKNNGVGNVTICVKEELSVKSNGVGNLNILGNPKIKKFQAITIGQ